MKLGILGAGNVGGTLGKQWAARGHDVRFGVRDPKDAKLQALLKEIGPKAVASSLREAASFGEVIVLALPWQAVPDALREAGDLKGKVVIDCTEPVSMGPDILTKGLLVGHSTSAGEQVAQWAPGARVVKALNTVGFGIMARPQFGAEKAVLFYCGDDAAAKTTTAELVGSLGFEAVDAGPLSNARLLEPVGMLWIYLAFTGLGPDFAFKLLRR